MSNRAASAARSGYKPQLRPWGLMVAMAFALLLTPAHAAQTALQAPLPKVTGKPDASTPQQTPDQQRNARIDRLMLALKDAPDEDSSSRIASELEQLWLSSSSDTSNLLMSWALKAMDDKRNGEALDMLDNIIQQTPSFAEAYNRRATVHYLEHQLDAALADAQKALELEPRNFDAIVGIASIYEDLGKRRSALAYYRRAVELYPKLPKLADKIKSLSYQVEGLPI